MAGVVLFDLDGTLYDRSGLKARMVLEAFRWKRPLRCLRLMFRERRCRHKLAGSLKGTVGYDTLFSLVSRKSGVPEEQVREWYWNWYMPRMAAVIGRYCRPREGLVAKIQALKDGGNRIAILSDYGFIKEKLDALGIDRNLFEAFLDSPSLGGFKPAPDVFRAACQYLRCTPEQAMMVGDRDNIDGGSRSVGIKYVNILDFMKK